MWSPSVGPVVVVIVVGVELEPRKGPRVDVGWCCFVAELSRDLVSEAGVYVAYWWISCFRVLVVLNGCS